MLQSLFAELKFSEKETKVYLALLEYGTLTPTEIAKKTKLNRATVYDITRTLVHRALISQYQKGRKTYFHCLDPKRLIDFLDLERDEFLKHIADQQARISESLPELISLQRPTSTKPRVQFFEGEKALREAYEDTLTATKEILAYTNVEAMFECFPKFFPDYFKRRAKAKVPIRAVFVQNPASFERARHDLEELRKTKFLPDPRKTFSPEVKIYNNKIMIASWKEKMAVMIESAELAELQRTIFETLWGVLGEKK